MAYKAVLKKNIVKKGLSQDNNVFLSPCYETENEGYHTIRILFSLKKLFFIQSRFTILEKL